MSTAGLGILGWMLADDPAIATAFVVAASRRLLPVLLPADTVYRLTN